MGIRDEPGILDSVFTGSQRLCGLVCGLVARLTYEKLNRSSPATGIKSGNLLRRRGVSSANGQVLCDDAAERTAVRGRRSATVVGSALPRLGAGSWAHGAGRRVTGPRISLALRRPRTLLNYSLEAMNITSQRRINATLIGAYFASYLPEPNAIDWHASQVGRWRGRVPRYGLGVLAYLAAAQRLRISRQSVLMLILG